MGQNELPISNLGIEDLVHGLCGDLEPGSGLEVTSESVSMWKLQLWNAPTLQAKSF